MTQIGDKFKLNSNEVMVIGMGLARILEDLEDIKNNASIPWTPEARKMQKDILESARSAALKIQAVSGFECQLDAYQEGDEDEFLTKPS